MGLSIGLVNFANDDKVKYGLVCEQSVEAGTVVEVGTRVNIVISLGKAPEREETKAPETTVEETTKNNRFDDWLNDRFKEN